MTAKLIENQKMFYLGSTTLQFGKITGWEVLGSKKLIRAPILSIDKKDVNLRTPTVSIDFAEEDE